MIDPDYLLKLTPLNAQNEENIIELDPFIVKGWIAFPGGTSIYLSGLPGHSLISVKENPSQIKDQLREIKVHYEDVLLDDVPEM